MTIKTTRLKRPQVPEPGELIDFDDIVGRPKYGGEEMTHETDIPSYEQVMEDVQTLVDAEAGARADSDNILAERINSEASTRGASDNVLQSQIDAIVASSDVKDIVGTKAELDNYDTSELGDNDIIKVLADETQSGATTYYRYVKASDSFSLIGAEGPYYTISESNTLLDGKADKATTYTKTETDTLLDAKADKINTYTKSEVDTALNEKQDNLTAGSNVQINNNVISATDTTYTAGTNVQINDNVISATDTTYSDFTGATASTAGANGLVPAPASGETTKFLKSDGTWGTPEGKTYTAGANIQINDTVISATDTTYGTMTGATASAAGTSGLVPAPVAGDNTKYLSGDGTWKTVSQYSLPIASDVTLGGVKVGNNLTIDASTGVLSADAQPAVLYSTLGQNTDGALTQKAASDAINAKADAASLATVATSGSYNDLSDKPTIPTQADINAAVAIETAARQSADNGLQTQIDALVASSDVRDIVGTKAELNNYDTSILGNNDIIKVLADESQGNATTYYRWVAASSTFTLIGAEGPYYTKSETDTALAAKANSADLATVATSGSYNDLSNKPTIPTVNNATLTISQNGASVGTFTANASANKTINVTDTTYSPFTGATSATPGASGLVPAPAAADVDKYLKGDGTWSEVQSGSTITIFYGEYDMTTGLPDFTTLYKDESCRNAATAGELLAAVKAGTVYIAFDSWQHQYTYHLYSYYEVMGYAEDGNTAQSGSPYSIMLVVNGGQYLWSLGSNPNSTTWAVQAVELQEKISAGNGISLNGNTVAVDTSVIATKSEIPTVNNATLTVQNDGVSAGTFTANASANKTINIVPPVKISSTLSTPSDVAYVGTNNITDSAVTTNKVAAGAITASKTDFGGNYSTSEVDTGFTWIDGKHIYKKTINTGALPNASETNTPHNITNLSKVIKIEGYAYRSTDGKFLPLPFAGLTSSNTTIDVSVVNGNVRFVNASNMSAFAESYVTLYYTRAS